MIPFSLVALTLGVSRNAAKLVPILIFPPNNNKLVSSKPLRGPFGTLKAWGLRNCYNSNLRRLHQFTFTATNSWRNTYHIWLVNNAEDSPNAELGNSQSCNVIWILCNVLLGDINQWSVLLVLLRGCSDKIAIWSPKIYRHSQSVGKFWHSWIGCFKITTVFSHAQTVVLCVSCSTVLCQPTGGRARLTEGCSFLKKPQ